ncbi:LysR family transcriptional regulator [Hydrogenovibrio marinus]|uniref:LysR family transcriptional regulator n=1 Tax=Hydrogenovibrio marinus TaxID=28885 RepID=A0A067A1N5_HYDMR|nr:LysR family transcriptional regulator [Hydrogenovibrio marinus]KDN96245.1 LysR family transcriptional regulator [Hydrogenovibrio marinus]
MGQLEKIEIFIRVVEAGGIGKAAEQLNMAKSAVSRRLSELEDELGAKLIHRTTRSSNLTEAGLRFYEKALGVVSAFSELTQSVNVDDQSLSGSLRIAVPLSFGMLHLTRVFDQFMRAYPGIHLDIDFSDGEVDLISSGFDMAIRISDLKDSSMQARKIAPIRFGLVASPEYLEQHGAPQSLQDLKNHQLLKYGNDGMNSWRLTDINGEKHDISFSTRLQANNGEFLKEMAKAGHGIVMEPTFIIWKDLQSGSLVPVLENYYRPEIYVYAVYPRNRFVSKKTRMMIDFLLDYFKQEAYWDAQ